MQLRGPTKMGDLLTSLSGFAMTKLT